MIKLTTQQWLLTLERVLLTLWVGSLWAIGYIAAPTLFKVLSDDRQLAGSLAGPMFTVVAYIGVAAGLILFAASLKSQGKQWRAWVILVMWLLVLCGLLVLQPMMQDLKAQGLAAGSEQLAQFRMLHGVSAVFHLLASLAGLALVAAGLRKGE